MNFYCLPHPSLLTDFSTVIFLFCLRLKDFRLVCVNVPCQSYTFVILANVCKLCICLSFILIRNSSIYEELLERMCVNFFKVVFCLLTLGNFGI